MEDRITSNSSYTEEERVEFQGQGKNHRHIKILASNDTTSEISEYVDEKMTTWLPEKNKTIEYSYGYSVSALDVAAYILKKTGPMTTMKLQKLVYFCQAWSLVWDEEPLFKENIEAWANGPVVRELFNYHRGQYKISSVLTGNPELLNEQQRETIDAVLDYYGNKTSQWLSDLTHLEDPWKLTRSGMPDLQRGRRIIQLDVLANYYFSLLPDEESANES